MCLDVAAIDGKLLRNRPCRRHRLEDALPDTALLQSVVAVVDRRGRAVSRRHVAPAAAGLKEMQDAGDDSPVIHTGLARLAMRQMRFNRRPSLF